MPGCRVLPGFLPRAEPDDQPRHDRDRHGQDHDHPLGDDRFAAPECLVRGGLEAGPCPLRQDAGLEEIPRLDAETPRDDEVGERQQGHHEQESAVDDRVVEQGHRDPAAERMTGGERQDQERHPGHEDQEQDLANSPGPVRVPEPQVQAQAVRGTAADEVKSLGIRHGEGLDARCQLPSSAVCTRSETLATPGQRVWIKDAAPSSRCHRQASTSTRAAIGWATMNFLICSDELSRRMPLYGAVILCYCPADHVDPRRCWIHGEFRNRRNGEAAAFVARVRDLASVSSGRFSVITFVGS